METLAERNSRIIAQRSNDPPEEPDRCLALHGNHDEHRCHLKPGHQEKAVPGNRDSTHECYCGVWW